MTSQMNFGPEWMRGGETSKRNLHFNSNSTSSKLDSQQHISSDNNDSTTPNTFKYSKEYMLSLYKSVDIPVDIEHHEYAITTKGQSPLSLLEDKFLYNNTTMNNSNNKSESDKNFLTRRSNLLSKGNDNFDFSNEFRRGSEVEDEPLWSGVDKDNVGTFDSNGVFHLGRSGGGSSSNLGGDTSLESSLEPEEDDDFNFDIRDLNIAFSTSIEKNNTPMNGSLYLGNTSLMTTNGDISDDPTKNSYRWVYRDPSGNVQGPFTGLDMQEWFEAGFFDHSLLIKREDAPFFEPLSALIQKVKNYKAPFLTPWPQEQQQLRQQSNAQLDRTNLLPPEVTSTSNTLIFNNNTDNSNGENFLGNHTLDRLPRLNDTLDAFNNSNGFAAKSNLGATPSSFNNPPFAASPLPRFNPTMNRTPLSSPWENGNSQNVSSSWLSNQNDPLHNDILQQRGNLLYGNIENSFGGGFSSANNYQQQQQQVMSQHMEQQYLDMLRRNQEQHIQLQQRMLQQQQQQLLIQQQQQRQQQQLFINNQNYDQQQRIVPPPPSLQQQQSINRGWNSVPGTPGVVEPMQSPYTTKFNNDPFGSAGFKSPRRSQSPTNITAPLPSQEEHQQKTQVEETDDQIAHTLNNASITENNPPVVEAPKSIKTIEKITTSPPSLPPTKQKEDVEKHQSNESSSASNTSAWGSTNSQKKTLREIQLEEEASSKKKTPQARSSTWSAVSATASKPVQQRAVPVVSPSFSANTRNHQVKSNNAWETPVRQKRVSMIASIPSSNNSLPRSHASSRHPTIKSEPKGPSEEFLKWCKLTLRGLNAGVKVDEILQMLLSFPVDNSCSEIIQDIIYANSATMDGRRFASDFITRRKADMDGKLNVVLPKSSMVNDNNSSNSVSEFKVVTKKGKKKHH